MKKFFLVCLAIIVTSILSLTTFGGYHNYQGENVEVYTRFFVTDSTGTHFNPYGLLSPTQVETQKVINDTTEFTFEFPYPYGMGFQCVEPADTTGENLVADQISRIIQDSIKRILLNTRFDYDGKMLTVRQAANPTNKQLAQAIVNLKLLGTASPEARKYGFEQSLMPGNIEPENQELAAARLLRTVDRLIYNLRYIDSLSIEGHAEELQFPDSVNAKLAVQEPTMLDEMRYVRGDVIIFTQWLEVTPVTAPVLFPFWLWSLVFGLIYLWNLRLPKLQRPKFQWAPFSWGGPLYFLKILVYCVGASILMTALFAFIDWRWVFFFMMLALIGIFGYFVIKYREVIMQTIIDFIIWFAELLLSVVMFIWRLILLIWKVLLFIWGVFVSIWNWLVKGATYLHQRWLVCWSALPKCWRRIFILLTLYAAFATYQWLACPC